MIKRIKELSKKEFVRNVFTLMSATTVAQVIAIVIYYVLAKIYSTSEHGIFALYMSIIAVTGIVSTGKYEPAVLMPDTDDKAFNLVALSSALCSFFSLFLLILVALFHNNVALLLGDPRIEKWLWFVPLSTLMIGHFQSLSYWSNRNKHYGRMAAANVGQSLANSAIKVSTSKVFTNGGGLISGALIGQFIGVGIYGMDFLRKNRALFSAINFQGMKEVAKEYQFFPRFAMIHYLINNFSSSLPIFVIAREFGAGNAGLYSFGFLMLFRPINLVTSSLTQVFSQRIISAYNRGGKIFPEVKKLTSRLFQFSLIPFILAGIFGTLVFTFIFGTKWTEAGDFMRILLPWLFVVLISSPLSFLPDMLKRQRKAMWLDILKLTLRIPALAIGVYYNNIYLALFLFSGISFLSVSYNLLWYLSLASVADSNEPKNRNQVIDVNILNEDVQNIQDI